MNYSLLTCHSEYSLLKSHNRCAKISERLEELGIENAALTDYGSVSGAVNFNQNVSVPKHILGSKLFLTFGDSTQKGNENRISCYDTVLAKSMNGWKSLLGLISLANDSSHFFDAPRLSKKDLTGNVDEIIYMTGAVDSSLAKLIIEDGRIIPDFKVVGCRYLKELQEIIDKDSLFVQVEAISNESILASQLASAVREIAKYCEIPVVATPNPHYLKREDQRDQHILLAGSVNGDLDKAKKTDILEKFFRSDRYHIPSYDEMKEYHSEEELANTNLVSDMCENYKITQSPIMPEFKCPDGMSDIQYLRELCIEGWNRLVKPVIDKNPALKNEYGKRQKYELSIFEEYNISSYFLIVADIIRECKSRGFITGVGRGSAAGCLTSYVTGITQVDPIKYGLLFERFLNPGRLSKEHTSPPDIDIDVPKEARQLMIDYARGKYGHDNVGQIITFTTLKAKKALKQVMGAEGNIPFEIQNAITKNLVDEAMINDELQEMKQDRGFKSGLLWSLENNGKDFEQWVKLDSDGNLQGEFANVFETALRLEYTKIIQSRHAAGVIISRNPIRELCPMVHTKGSKDLAAGFEGEDCEAAGLLKLDILGIRSLDKVQDVARLAAGIGVIR